MADGFVHTVRKNDKWLNEIEGKDVVLGASPTRENAISVGRERAKRDKTEHVIHNQDGTISERNSYGNDPADRAG